MSDLQGWTDRASRFFYSDTSTVKSVTMIFPSCLNSPKTVYVPGVGKIVVHGWVINLGPKLSGAK